ncbi:hypothetical protein V8C86DRAFT_2879927 [Haematococcus lacustris]
MAALYLERLLQHELRLVDGVIRRLRSQPRHQRATQVRALPYLNRPRCHERQRQVAGLQLSTHEPARCSGARRIGCAAAAGLDGTHPRAAAESAGSGSPGRYLDPGGAAGAVEQRQQQPAGSTLGPEQQAATARPQPPPPWPHSDSRRGLALRDGGSGGGGGVALPGAGQHPPAEPARHVRRGGCRGGLAGAGAAAQGAAAGRGPRRLGDLQLWRPGLGLEPPPGGPGPAPPWCRLH